MPVLTSRPERTVAPTFEPITIADAKLQLRIDASNSDHDTLLGYLIAAARETFERDTDYVCCTSTWRERFDSWQGCSDGDECGEIVLSKRPVASVLSITYVDSNGATQTWSSANYALDNGRGMPAVVRGYDIDFPSLRPQYNAVTVAYVCGSAQADVPQNVKHAIRLLVGEWFDEPAAARGGTIAELPLGYQRLVANFQRPSYP
jgi:uncharacterized phiE125 gp8 family phage protein